MTTKITLGVVGPAVLDRSNHTGTQAQSTIVGLPGDLAVRAPFSYSGKTANYTVVVADNGAYIGVSASGGARTIALPAAASVPVGFHVTIKKVDTSANTVTLDPDASETIDGATTKVLRLSQQAVTVANTGSAWLIIDEGVTSEKGSNANGDYVRYANGYMRAWGAITITPVANTITTGTATFPLVFAAAPKVGVTMNYGSNTQTACGFQTVTTTTALIAVLRTNTSDMVCNWSADGAWY